MPTALALFLASAAGLGDLSPVPADALRVYLVRHGQAFSNLDPTPNLPPEKLDRLTATGIDHAERAGRALRGRGIRVVVDMADWPLLLLTSHVPAEAKAPAR